MVLHNFFSKYIAYNEVQKRNKELKGENYQNQERLCNSGYIFRNPKKLLISRIEKRLRKGFLKLITPHGVKLWVSNNYQTHTNHVCIFYYHSKESMELKKLHEYKGIESKILPTCDNFYLIWCEPHTIMLKIYHSSRHPLRDTKLGTCRPNKISKKEPFLFMFDMYHSQSQPQKIL